METSDDSSSQQFWRMAWALSAVTACLVIGSWRTLAWARRSSGRERFFAKRQGAPGNIRNVPNRVKAIVQDQHGINLVLSDKEDVPNPRSVIKICDGKKLPAMVTFSGQEIKLGRRN